MKDYKCECKEPGWCERHQTQKHGSQFQYCQEDSERGRRYRRMWDEQKSILQKAGSLTKAYIDHVKSGNKKVSKEKLKIRLEICDSCEFLRVGCGNQKACQLCGCNLKLKASWEEQKCPEGKWSLPIVKKVSH